MKIDIKNRQTHEVIFSHEQENNTIKKTVELAVKNNVSLENVNLENANLEDANLNNANLKNANLVSARLTNSFFINANLENANLQDVCFFQTDLENANLKNALLHWAIGNMREIRTLFLSDYVVTFTKDILAIGCKQYTHQEWRDFDDETIDLMGDNALVFWKKWKSFIFQAIDLSFLE